MDFHSFQYPPRPIPSDTHKPSRYYFHNLDQDTVLVHKNKPTGFQKEGVPPALTTSLSARALDASPSSSSSSSANGTQPPQQRPLQEEPSSPVQNFAAPAPPSPANNNIAALEILDRTKFIAT
ncbi:hypothetical protein BGZ70_003355 [Mortierella alpina]|uniref:Uncharacterized protein n=1 Tax=Mortierella alpina TaxID=64518 RepID=A0A9P6M737_MORAP|nr:hypothetical protein BGZ70_003355 [Mortierella alpina]